MSEINAFIHSVADFRDADEVERLI